MRKPRAAKLAAGATMLGLLVLLTWLALRWGSEHRADKSKPADRAPLPGRNIARVTRGVSALADNAHVRLVWVEHRTRRGYDPFGEQKNYRLVGFDNGQGGFRVLGRRWDNYSRPLLTPDGSAVVYTERRGLENRGGRKPEVRPSTASGAAATSGVANPERSSLIKIIPWAGGAPTFLAGGSAISTWRDPATGQDWIYFVEDEPGPQGRRGILQSVQRFLLTDPTRREVVWRGTPLSIDNFHLSRDGRVFAALFPWPEAGIGEFAGHQWRKLELGCWPALAPDNSRLAWVLDGAHKRLRLFDASFRRFAELDLTEAPGMKRCAAFHPRWSNHPRFIVMTGPYVSGAKGRDALSAGAGHAEIHLGKLRDDCTAVEGWVRITSNRAGDFFPDAWIEGGDKAVLGTFPQHAGQPATLDLTERWPADRTGLAFAWNNAKTDNRLGAHTQGCFLMARGTARHGRHFDLLLDGGSFEMDADSATRWVNEVQQSRAFFIQILLTEEGNGPIAAAGVPLLRGVAESGTPSLLLRRMPSGLRIEMLKAPDPAPPGLWRDDLETQAMASNRPVVISLVWNAHQFEWFVDGKLVRTSRSAPGDWPGADHPLTLEFGTAETEWPSRWWRAERIIFGSEAKSAPAVAAEAEAAAAAEAANRRRPTPSRIMARVLSATMPEPERLDVYKRMLVDHTYDVLKVIEGPELTAKRLSVLHWAILDEQPVAGIPRRPGEELTLLVEPAEEHPELEGELTLNGDSDFSLPLFYDIEPAKLQ